MLIPYVVRRRGFSVNLVFRWHRRTVEDGKEAGRVGDNVTANIEARAFENRVRVPGCGLGK